MRLPFILTIATLLFFNFQAFSQSELSNRKEIDIVKVYKKVVEDGYESIQIYQTLANTTYERRQYTAARKWFEKWFQMDKKPERAAYLKYARTLESLGEQELAKKYFDLYESKK